MYEVPAQTTSLYHGARARLAALLWLAAGVIAPLVGALLDRAAGTSVLSVSPQAPALVFSRHGVLWVPIHGVLVGGLYGALQWYAMRLARLRVSALWIAATASGWLISALVYCMLFSFLELDTWARKGIPAIQFDSNWIARHGLALMLSWLTPFPVVAVWHSRLLPRGISGAAGWGLAYFLTWGLSTVLIVQALPKHTAHGWVSGWAGPWPTPLLQDVIVANVAGLGTGLLLLVLVRNAAKQEQPSAAGPLAP